MQQSDLPEPLGRRGVQNQVCGHPKKGVQTPSWLTSGLCPSGERLRLWFQRSPFASYRSAQLGELHLGRRRPGAENF